MLASAVVCTYNPDNYANLNETIASLQEQTHPEIEIIIVVDGSEEVYRKVIADYAEKGMIRPLLLTKNAGVCSARNAGIRAARGEIVAFIDDDAVANKDWIKSLLDIYRDYNAVAVGGKVLPVWFWEQPDYLPEEMFWLIGVTNGVLTGDKVVELRNVFGVNMSFRRAIFEDIGLFNEGLGFSKALVCLKQAEEAEFGLRMKNKTGKGMYYSPDAIVYHKITRSKMGLKSLLRRAFYQGYSKALLGKLSQSTAARATERSYLRSLLTKYIPRRLKNVYRFKEAKKLAFIAAVVISVFLGFAYGYMSPEQGRLTAAKIFSFF